MKQSSEPIEETQPEPLPILYVKGTLKNPSRGEDVKVLQQRLKDLGYYTDEVDGIFLKYTEDAVRKFQQDKDLLVDGIAGAITLRALGVEVVQNVKSPDLSSMEDGTAPWYEAAFAALSYDAGFETVIQNAAKKLVASRERYQAVAKTLGIKVEVSGIDPWMVIGGIHNMESSMNFAGVLHNGEKIIGTGKKTTLVPKGRGPFKTWEDAAIDALVMKGFQAIKNWSAGNILGVVERYNGTGYISGAGKAERSPYLWAQSNINDGRGKYTSDGKFDPNANSNGQTGFATLMKEVLRIVSPQPVPQPEIKSDLFDRIMAANSDIEPRMVKLAVKHFESNPAIENKDLFLMFNVSLRDNVQRLYIVDVATGKAERDEAAHGKNSDPNKDGYATEFGNVSGSFKTSLGAALIGNQFKNPKWKWVRLMYGLEKGLNDNILKREILIHSTKYVDNDPKTLSGDTLGCVGLAESTADRIMPKIGGALIYTWAPELEA